MLVLSRKIGETIQVHMRDGRVVEVKVTDILFRYGERSRVKLGISAPSDVVVLREEVPMQAGDRRPGLTTNIYTQEPQT